MLSKNVWIGSWPHTVRMGKTRWRYHMAQVAAQCPYAKALALPGYIAASDCILGFATVTVIDVYTHLTVLTPYEREQYKFWTDTLGCNLEGKMYRCKVSGVTSLRQPRPIQHALLRLSYGFVVELEEGFPGQLAEELGIVDPDPPCVAMRLPTAFACLVSAGKWDSVLLPNVSRAWGVQWAKLGIAQRSLPTTPAWFGGHLHRPDLDEELTKEIAQSVADELRLFAHNLRPGDEDDDDEELARLRYIHDYVSTLQAYADQQELQAIKRVTHMFSGNMSRDKNQLCTCNSLHRKVACLPTGVSLLLRHWCRLAY